MRTNTDRTGRQAGRQAGSRPWQLQCRPGYGRHARLLHARPATSCSAGPGTTGTPGCCMHAQPPAAVQARVRQACPVAACTPSHCSQASVLAFVASIVPSPFRTHVCQPLRQPLHPPLCPPLHPPLRPPFDPPLRPPFDPPLRPPLRPPRHLLRPQEAGHAVVHLLHRCAHLCEERGGRSEGAHNNLMFCSRHQKTEARQQKGQGRRQSWRHSWGQAAASLTQRPRRSTCRRLSSHAASSWQPRCLVLAATLPPLTPPPPPPPHTHTHPTHPPRTHTHTHTHLVSHPLPRRRVKQLQVPLLLWTHPAAQMGGMGGPATVSVRRFCMWQLLQAMQPGGRPAAGQREWSCRAPVQHMHAQPDLR